MWKYEEILANVLESNMVSAEWTFFCLFVQIKRNCDKAPVHEKWSHIFLQQQFLLIWELSVKFSLRFSFNDNLLHFKGDSKPFYFFFHFEELHNYGHCQLYSSPKHRRILEINRSKNWSNVKKNNTNIINIEVFMTQRTNSTALKRMRA